MSCRRTPESQPVTVLKIRESTRRANGSLRCVFHPVTRSYPSSSFASSRGISAGSSCRSPSIVTTIVALDLAEPGVERGRLADVAAEPDDPDVRRARVEPDERSVRSVARAVVDEHDLPRLAALGERLGELVVEPLDGELLVTDGDDDRDHAPERTPCVPSAPWPIPSPSTTRSRTSSRARQPLPGEPVPLEEAAGRVLAEDARAAVDLPRFPSSAMDGFALRAADTPGTLPIVARVAAGRPAPRPLVARRGDGDRDRRCRPGGSGRRRPGRARHRAATAPCRCRPRPSRARTSGRSAATSAPATRSCQAGTTLSPSRIAALAAAGVAAAASAARDPASPIVTTGTELRPPGEPLADGEIYESNGVMLAAAVPFRGRRGRAPRDRLGRRGRAPGRARRAASRRTSSSPPAASRSARTISSAARSPSSARRRSSGASRCAPASRSRSPPAAARSSSGCPGTPYRRSSARCSSSSRRFARSAGRARPGAAVPTRASSARPPAGTRTATTSSGRGVEDIRRRVRCSSRSRVRTRT